jgi:beta-xylosidase
VFSFPGTSGPYKIGTVTYHWTDVSRHEVFTLDKNMSRELMVQIWYPAKKTESTNHAPYIQNPNGVSSAMARLHNLPSFALSHLKFVTTNATVSASVADDKPNYPVLIYWLPSDEHFSD